MIGFWATEAVTHHAALVAQDTGRTWVHKTAFDEERRALLLAQRAFAKVDVAHLETSEHWIELRRRPWPKNT